MLLEFSCSNHKSIREKVVFSFLAGEDGSYFDTLYHFEGLNILRIALIYGANGSGKSNLISALAFMKALVTNSINHKPSDPVMQTPHKLEGFSSESIFNIKFIKNGTRYDYGFSLKNMAVYKEYLYL